MVVLTEINSICLSKGILESNLLLQMCSSIMLLFSVSGLTHIFISRDNI